MTLTHQKREEVERLVAELRQEAKRDHERDIYIAQYPVQPGQTSLRLSRAADALTLLLTELSSAEERAWVAGRDAALEHVKDGIAHCHNFAEQAEDHGDTKARDRFMREADHFELRAARIAALPPPVAPVEREHR